MSTLTVASGQTHTVNSGTLEAYGLADIDGTLRINGTLVLKEGAGTGEGDAVNPLYDDLVGADTDDLLIDENLYDDLVAIGNNLSTALVIAVFAVLALFGYLSMKFRSVILGVVWLFMGVSFVLAVLIDLSLTYFWVSVVFGFFATIGAIVEAGR